MTASPFPPAPQPQPGAPAPDAHRRGFFARHKVLTGFLVLAVVVIGASVASGGGSDPAPDTGAGPVADGATSAGTDGVAADGSAAGTAEAPAEDPGPGLGTPVRDGKFEFTVTALEPGVARIGDEYLGEDAQGQFVLVHVTVTNIGDEAQYFDASSQLLVDTLDRQHSADTAAAIYVDDSNSFLNQINPGNSVEGIVVFDIPADAVPATVELHDSMLSGGVTVRVG